MQFAIEKYLISVGLMVAFAALIGVFVYAYHTEVSNPPLDTQKEAFKGVVGAVESNSILQLDENTPLSKAHVNNKEIERWLNTSVSEALTFDGPNYQSVLKNVRPYFTASGFEQYKAALSTIRIIKALESGAYTIGVFSEQNPYVGRGLVYQDVYRWQAKVPHFISYVSTKDGSVQNRQFDLDVVVRRVSKERSESGVQIETWQIKPARR